jgi:hypothetical protein
MNFIQQLVLIILGIIASSGLITLIVQQIFKINEAKLAKVKAFYEAWKPVITQAVLTAQAIYKTGHGEEKFKYVSDFILSKIPLPKEEVTVFIESTLAELKLAWGKQWDILGTPETPPPIAPTTITFPSEPTTGGTSPPTTPTDN